MLLRKVRSITGRPKYILGASDYCIHYLQDLPTCTTDINGKRTVTEPSSGVIFLENIGLKAALDRAALNYNALRDREVRRYEYELEMYRSHHRSGSGSLGITSNHNREMSAIGRNYNTITSNLKSGLTLIIPVYVVSHWTAPEPDGVRSLFAMDGLPEKELIESAEKWRSPKQWKKLKVNLPKNNVMVLLGGKGIIDSGSSQLDVHYGEIDGYATLTFIMRSDGKYRLSHWKEPFWPSVHEGN